MLSWTSIPLFHYYLQTLSSLRSYASNTAVTVQRYVDYHKDLLQQSFERRLGKLAGAPVLPAFGCGFECVLALLTLTLFPGMIVMHVAAMIPQKNAWTVLLTMPAD